jgi:hypothetical protein
MALYPPSWSLGTSPQLVRVEYVPVCTCTWRYWALSTLRRRPNDKARDWDPDAKNSPCYPPPAPPWGGGGGDTLTLVISALWFGCELGVPVEQEV